MEVCVASLRRLKLGWFMKRLDAELLTAYARVAFEMHIDGADSGPEWVGELTPEQQARLYRDFTRVNHMCTDVGRRTLLDAQEGRAPVVLNDEQVFAGDPENVYDVALATFLCRPALFDRVYRRAECDRQEGRVRIWGHPGPEVPKTIDELADGLRERLTELHDGRGDRSRYLVETVAEHPESGEVWNLLITFEKHESVFEVFQGSNRELRIQVQRLRPLKRELAVYHRAAGRLELKAWRDSTQRTEVLRKALGHCLFGDPEHFTESLRVDLSGVLQLAHRLPEIAEQAHLERAELVMIKGVIDGEPGARFEISSSDVFKALEHRIPLVDPEVQAATFRIHYRVQGKAANVRVTLKVTGANDMKESKAWPRHEATDQFIEWGLLQEPNMIVMDSPSPAG